MNEVNGYEVYMVFNSNYKEKDTVDSLNYLFGNTNKFNNLKLAKERKKSLKLLFPNAEFCIKGF